MVKPPAQAPSAGDAVADGNALAAVGAPWVVQPLWRNPAVSSRANGLSPYGPATVHVGIYTKEWKTYIHTKTCALMFTAAFSVTAGAWKQPRRPSFSG